MKSATSVALWRCSIVILALAAIIQTGIELIGAPRVLTLGVRAEPLFTGPYLTERGPTTFVVEKVPVASPLAAAGVLPGDHLRYDRPLGRFYGLAAGDKVALTVIRGDNTRRIEVAVPAADTLPRYELATYSLGHIATFTSLVIGILVGWRRTDSTALRAFAVTCLLVSVRYPYSAPEAIHLPWMDYIGSVSSVVWQGVPVLFALNYPDDRPVGWRAILKRFYPWFFGVHLLAAIVYMGRLYAGYFEPLCLPVFRVAEIVEPILFLVAIVLAWRHSSGELRVRFRWIVATLGAIAVMFLFASLNRWTRLVPEDLFDLITVLTMFVAEIALVYAVFRHRIFDFGFAINRALVYGVATGILLLAFFVLEKVAEHYVHFDSRGKNALLDGGIALGVFLFFHRVRHWVEHHLERLLFSKWHRNEQGLKRFIKQAEHISESDPLLAAMTNEFDRFSNGAGNATYRRSADGHFLRTAGTLDGAREIVDANEPMVVALRTDRLPTPIANTTSLLPGAIAFPMTHRAELDGFVLLGPKPGNEIYRPDEIELLGFAANQVGLDLHAIEAEEFRRDAKALAHEVALLRTSNQEMQNLVRLALAGHPKVQPEE